MQSFQDLQGGPLMHVIAAKAVCFKEALDDDFKDYSKKVISNAKILSNRLIKNGFKIFSGGTDTHLMLVDLRKFKVTGKDAEASLVRSNITCNKNGIPFDSTKSDDNIRHKTWNTCLHYERIWTKEFTLIADLISKVVKGLSEKP